LTQAQIDEVYKQNTPVKFQKEQFQTQVKNQQERRDIISASTPIDIDDIFYPVDYLRKVKR
jgi:hypothetical protein